MTIDLSLKNAIIAEYFSGKTNEPPVPEFMFVHTHRIRGNFVEQIEKMVLQASTIIEANPKRHVKTSGLFLDLAIKLGQQLSDVSEKNAPAILSTLRQIFMLAKIVIE